MADELVVDKPDSVLDLAEFLGEDDDKTSEASKEPKKVATGDDKDDKEETEKKEEIELSDSDEDEPAKEIDELEFVPHAGRKQILKDYPDLFKKYPSLERAYFKEQQYAEIVPTIEDAKVAVEKANNFDRFSETLLSGNTEQILKSVKDSDPNAFGKVVDNYLGALNKVDSEAYFHVVGTLFDNLIVAMSREAENIKNDDLKAAALILNQFLGRGTQFQHHGSFNKNAQNDPEREKINQERQSILQERFDTAKTELETRAHNIIKNTISENIDPTNVMTDFVRKHAVTEAIESVYSAINEDDRFKNLLDKLWVKAKDNKFSQSSKDAIRAAFLHKAKSLLPGAIKKARNEALKGLGKRASDDREEPTKRGPIAAGKSAPSSSSSSSGRGGKNEMLPKESVMDFLMRD